MRNGSSDLRDAVARAAEGTPYTVVDTDKGFNLELDVANAQWWDLLGRAGLKRAFTWKVTERTSSYTITDHDRRLTWQAGAPALGGSYSMQRGRILSFSRQNIWALSDRGRIEPVVNYRFNSREGRDLIRMAAKQLGLKERMPWAIKGTFIALAVCVALGILDNIRMEADPAAPDRCGTARIMLSNNQDFEDRLAKTGYASPGQYRDRAKSLQSWADWISDSDIHEKAYSVAHLADRVATLKYARDPESISKIPQTEERLKAAIADLAAACPKTPVSPASTGATK